MSIMFPRPRLDVDETVVHEMIGNVFAGWRPRPGRLTLTDRRFLFTPARFNILSIGPAIDLDRRKITGIEPVESREIGRPRNLAEAVQGRIRIRHAAGSLTLTAREPQGFFRALTRLDD